MAQPALRYAERLCQLFLSHADFFHPGFGQVLPSLFHSHDYYIPYLLSNFHFVLFL
ncbi:hypothetical protein J051_2773 [Klebsiella pneumoniae 440_1540]|uniref:Uncharacterized protein n=3 Tax=Klebsiella pneumoniae TaxID=573 RepID=A0A0H3GNL2_KLEPH|nr:hypothetical protein [Klebsiella pneumoniae]YP_005226550.1 hypothetical protein KPHS_22500 [Klebsiella pneumoniae subsp. pneumoniae HS11286]AHM79927.1 hypothetical protein KPNJ2_03147 [Klebsiella pneumoniae 30684/NJST258_2]AHM85560.1 hypothetical protein KPNJ1_03154 [Klebsiella pneumoniae 30660/NJST258_1]EOR15358.1 hypothetical protein H208_3063 [Klebsiella pneumoniae UHKPC23]EOY72205.1 hypothetical protein H207_2585 [Klebsiella pneumoniae UHKPC40]EOY79101.1 hypothetical protein H230_3019 